MSDATMQILQHGNMPIWGETQTMEHVLTCSLSGYTSQEDLANFNNQANDA